MPDASTPTSLTDLSAVALSAAIAARRVSCVEVMGAYLDRIERLNPSVNAIVALENRGDLLRKAWKRDEALRRGDSLGPLHGFPHAVKDLQAVADITFTRGSPLLKDFVPDTDSLMVGRLRAAGVIFIGKTNTPEFGLGSHTYNPVYGLTRNPYDLTKSAGGSSGGAAVGLALKMLPLADGSDYGGSLRNPAGWNNVCGFRPSIGRVPTHDRDDWLPSMGVLGPMARSVEDLALLLSVQAGFDPRAPLSLPIPPGHFTGDLRADMKGKRIAWLGDFGGFAPCDPEVLETCRAALKTFEALGCIVEEAVPAFDLQAVWDAFMTLRHWQAGGNLLDFYRDPDKRALMKPEAVFEVERGLTLSAFDITAASVVRTAWSQTVARFLETYDYMLAPTAQTFPFDAAQSWPRQIAGQTMATYHEWMKGVCLVTMSGCPSLAVPAGFGAAGLPMGLQIIAPVQQDLSALKLGHAFETAAPWTRDRPPALGAD
jgi:amidase